MKPEERFTKTVDDYERYRPDYPGAVFEVLLRSDPKRVVDVGCGTGISSRALASRGVAVVGVEPNTAMRARAIATGGGVEYREGTAEALPLADRSVDLWTAFQAFHWFRREETLREIQRVLAPEGRAAVVWNIRAEGVPFMDAYEALLSTLTAYQEVTRFDDALAWIDAQQGFATKETVDLAHEQILDREGFFGRVHSSSYVAHGVVDRDAFDAALGQLFQRFEEGGRIRFSYRTRGRLLGLQTSGAL